MAKNRTQEAIQLEATIPMIKSAINVAGDGGGQVKLEVPESSMAEFKRLMDWRGCVLRVTIEVE